MTPATDRAILPHVTIFAESGPLAGDLAACLSGRFMVERVTDRKAAIKSLAAGCQALLIMGRTPDDFGPADTDLIRQSIASSCRVLVLGAGGLHLEQELERSIVYLPALPSPQQLLENLSDLGPGQLSGVS